jgi:hypothetical protein
MTQADSPHGLGMPPVGVEPPATGGDPEISFLPPPPITHELHIRVYDYCPEHGFHTDPELAPAGEGL